MRHLKQTRDKNCSQTCLAMITKQDMDDKLQTDKGWLCNHNGNEYVYDFHLKKFPVIIKVASTIKKDETKKGNKNSHRIRVYAVRKESIDTKAKICGGVIKAREIDVTPNWQREIEKQILSVIKSAKVVYNKRKR